MGYLQKLIGKQIKDIYFGAGEFYALGTDEKQTFDEIILYLEDYSLTISNRIDIDPRIKNINELKDGIIKQLIETKEEIKIIFNDASWILINLRDEAYNGPEALVLHGPENLILVWN